jgi:hypothetical protein
MFQNLLDKLILYISKELDFLLLVTSSFAELSLPVVNSSFDGNKSAHNIAGL